MSCYAASIGRRLRLRSGLMLNRFPLPNAKTMTETMSGPRSSGTRRTGIGFATAVWVACLCLTALPGQGLAASPGPSSGAEPSAEPSALSDALALHATLDYGAAFSLLLPLAEKGDPVAQEVVGFMYAHGEAVPLNRRAAFELSLIHI